MTFRLRIELTLPKSSPREQASAKPTLKNELRKWPTKRRLRLTQLARVPPSCRFGLRLQCWQEPSPRASQRLKAASIEMAVGTTECVSYPPERYLPRMCRELAS